MRSNSPSALTSVPVEPVKVLTIGGSDSGGAAGIQADLKTMTLLGSYAMSVLTVVTAQNSQAVTGAHFLPPDFVTEQLHAVLSDYGAAAIKTGFIGRAALIEAIARGLVDWTGQLVVDPVLVNHRAETMFPAAVSEAYRQMLFPLATLLTPNRAEVGVLLGHMPQSVVEMEQAARRLTESGAQAVLITGLPSEGRLVDLLFDGQAIHTFASPSIATDNTHGSGDTLSAAITTYLARGKPLVEAVRAAHRFTHAAILAGQSWQLGAGHGPLGQWLVDR